MRITITTYIESPTAKTYDPVVDHVAKALRQHGHTVSILTAHNDVGKFIAGLRRRKPDLVFNLMEMFGDDVCGDKAVAGLYDLLQIPYTGGGPGELYLQQDKALGKKLLAYENILYPNFAVFAPDASLETGGNLRMPLFVKPLRGDASIGINGKALVENSKELLKQVTSIHSKHGDSALAEEFIDGREFYVAILGNQNPEAFPPLEMDFSNMPEGKARVMDRRAKFEKRSNEFKGSRIVLADVSDELKAKLQKTALESYRAIRIRDYGRVDLRLTNTNEIYVLEANASCYLHPDEEFAVAAKAAGYEYDALVEKIAQLALDRSKSKLSI